jgi:hypothetical protein
MRGIRGSRICEYGQAVHSESNRSASDSLVYVGISQVAIILENDVNVFDIDLVIRIVLGYQLERSDIFRKIRCRRVCVEVVGLDV